MRKWIVFLTSVFFFVSFTGYKERDGLRSLYARTASEWPKPFVDEGVAWLELDTLPYYRFEGNKDSVDKLVELGKKLFFDPRLSGSGKISCATCHRPELSWTDGLEKSVGHEGQINKRNSPSLQNVWFYNRLFWDGRSSGLEDQAFAPINSESEMHGDMRELPRKLRRIEGYGPLFEAAWGDPVPDPDRIAGALAAFQRTIFSNKSRFDLFLSGDTRALTDRELNGLHLFRTKARCMNCHNGALFSDNHFHNNGFAGKDRGLYDFTHKHADMGKMRTPSLRDVMMTGPWMHDGMQRDMGEIIDRYNRGATHTQTDTLIRPLALSRREKADLLAFLNAISSPPRPFNTPELP